MPMSPDDLLALIDQHLATGDYDWARDTLEGIRSTVEDTNRVTLRQQEAVEHIIHGRLKHDAWRG
jgi:hypothetical protein